MNRTEIFWFYFKLQFWFRFDSQPKPNRTVYYQACCKSLIERIGKWFMVFFFLSFLGKEWFMFLTQVKIRVSEWGIFVSVKFDQLKLLKGTLLTFRELGYHVTKQFCLVFIFTLSSSSFYNFFFFWPFKF